MADRRHLVERALFPNRIALSTSAGPRAAGPCHRWSFLEGRTGRATDAEEDRPPRRAAEPLPGPTPRGRIPPPPAPPGAGRAEVGQVLYEARGAVDYAYFPTGAVLSALTVMRDGNAIEVATVGNEGLVGHYGFGGKTSPHRVIVQVGDGGLRIAVAGPARGRPSRTAR